MKGFPAWVGTAVITPDERYRYSLTRTWCGADPLLHATMLNPSTASAEVNDNTIVRLMWFAYDNGFGGIEVTNLFAFRATNPADLLRVDDPIGPENDLHIAAGAKRGYMTLCAWGTHGAYHGRGDIVLADLKRQRVRLRSLGFTKNGHPKHPLYLPRDTELQEIT